MPTHLDPSCLFPHYQFPSFTFSRTYFLHPPSLRVPASCILFWVSFQSSIVIAMEPSRPDAAAAPAPAPNSSFAPNAAMRRRFVREVWLNGQLHTPENAREFTKFTDWHTRGLCSQLVARPGAVAHFSEDWIDYQVDLAIWGCLRKFAIHQNSPVS